MMEDINYGLFGDNEVKVLIASLSQPEKKELSEGMTEVLKKMSEKMDKLNLFDSKCIANIRLGDRKFKIEFVVKFPQGKLGSIIINSLKELSTDEYLDSINDSKNLGDDFVDLKV
jgi:hypothetical protein